MIRAWHGSAPLTLTVLLVIGPAIGVLAQPQYFFINASNTVTPDQPTTDVEVWAVFDPDFYAFAASSFSIASGPDDGAFYDPRFPYPFLGEVGKIAPDGDAITGVESSQLQYPPNLIADTANPIMIWSCSWTTTDFTPRGLHVSLSAPDVFWVYFNVYGDAGLVEYDPEAFGVIQVVPTPAPAALLLLGMGLATQRRR